MKLATKEDLETMKRGEPVLVNLVDDVPDICLFLEYIPARKKILVLDTFIKDKHGRYIPNIAEYDRCMLIEANDEFYARLAHSKE
jgi:hypothetical protein